MGFVVWAPPPQSKILATPMQLSTVKENAVQAVKEKIKRFTSKSFAQNGSIFKS